MNEGASTPWGPADGVDYLAPGIWKVYTASHGGIKLSPERAAGMPAAFMGASQDGFGTWWEEDCAWSLVALVYPEAFPRQPWHSKDYDPMDTARQMAARYYANIIQEAKDGDALLATA